MLRWRHAHGQAKRLKELQAEIPRLRRTVADLTEARQPVIREFDRFMDTLGLGAAEDIALHASLIAAGRSKPWKGVPRKRRLEIIEAGLEILRASHRSKKLFAVT